MIILESGEILEENTVTTIVQEIIGCLRNHGVSVMAAKHLLDKTKQEIEKAKV